MNKQNTKKINVAQLSEILRNPKTYRGCNFVGFDALTDVKLKGGKKNKQQNRVSKLHEGFLAMLFSNKLRNAYCKMVNKRLKEQDANAKEFVLSALPWGVRVKDTAVIEHKGQDYVQLIYVQHSVKLLGLANQLGIDFSENDLILEKLMGDKVIAYNTPNGKISYLRNGQPIAKEEIIGLKENKANGKQGGLKEEMKVIVKTFKLNSITRMTLNGVRYEIVD